MPSNQETSEQTSDEHEGKPTVETEHLPVPSDHESDGETSEQPSDWRRLDWLANWLAALIISFLIIVSFGTKAKNPNRQDFLESVILLQTLTLTIIIRAIAAFKFSEEGLGGFFKMIGIGALCFVMLLLSLCSTDLQTSYRFWG
ncbi:hypothetical protein AGMMS50256_21020 [Betaproteobacteria bacterium]|nr:hypothetical protein AGMMS50256_21020 [Betaproteobacteria bacterium]